MKAKVKLPLKLAEAFLCKRGAIFKMLEVFENTGVAKDKYHVVVGVDETSDPVLLILTTSKTDWYDKHPNVSDYVRVAAGVIETLPPVTTIVQCRQIYLAVRARLLERYVADELEYCGQMPSEILAQIDAALAASSSLSPAEKAAVIP